MEGQHLPGLDADCFPDDEDRPLEIAAADALDLDYDNCWARLPEQRLPHLTHAGKEIYEQVAVLSGDELSDAEIATVFLDLRGLALCISWITWSSADW